MIFYARGSVSDIFRSKTSVLLFQGSSHYTLDSEVDDGSFGNVMTNVHLEPPSYKLPKLLLSHLGGLW
jgi:hypothetical protein